MMLLVAAIEYFLINVTKIMMWCGALSDAAVPGALKICVGQIHAFEFLIDDHTRASNRDF